VYVFRTLPLLARETLWQARIYLRDRAAVFFTFAFPILVLFFWSWQGTNVLTAAAFVAALALAMAGYAGLAMGIAAAREEGLLKRIRSTPLPMFAHITARALAAGVLGALAVGLTLGVGVTALGLPLAVGKAMGLLPGLLAGFIALGGWGLVVGSLAKTAAAASYLANLTLFPLFLLSAAAQRGMLPDWAAAITPWLPLQSLSILIQQTLAGEGWSLLPLLTLLVWGGLGLVLAAWRLSRPL
jgi:ABC-2 type transport system permease protein